MSPLRYKCREKIQGTEETDTTEAAPWRTSIWLPLVVVSLLPAQNHIDSRDDKIDLRTRDFAHPLCKLLLIERDDKRNVCDGVLWKTRYSGA